MFFLHEISKIASLHVNFSLPTISLHCHQCVVILSFPSQYVGWGQTCPHLRWCYSRWTVTMLCTLGCSLCYEELWPGWLRYWLSQWSWSIPSLYSAMIVLMVALKSSTLTPIWSSASCLFCNRFCSIKNLKLPICLSWGWRQKVKSSAPQPKGQTYIKLCIQGSVQFEGRSMIDEVKHVRDFYNAAQACLVLGLCPSQVLSCIVQFPNNHLELLDFGVPRSTESSHP